MLPLRDRVDLGVMAMNDPHSPMLLHYWNLTIRLFSIISTTLVEGGSYPSAEMQSVYSTAAPAADLAIRILVEGSFTPLQRCSRCILQPPAILGNTENS